jgi:riboflavin biosynthesis pyrimidine reductase
MRLLLPGAPRPAGAELSLAELAELYAYPGHDRPWLRANMVESADGAASVGGRSRGLSGDADRLVFALLRSLADVILVGAQTARAERYGPVKPDQIRPELRAGRPAPPPIAVVSRRLDLDPEAALFTAAPPAARTIVITTELAPEQRRAELARSTDVIVAGADTVDLRSAVAALAARGHRRLLSEGGPHLLGELAGAGLIDELCVTISPMMVGPGPNRIIAGLGLGDAATPGQGVPLRLGHLLEDSSFLFCRYTAHPPGGDPAEDPASQDRGPQDPAAQDPAGRA